MDSNAASPQPPRNFLTAINWPLMALAVATFGIGTTEFGPMGFLPYIAKDLNTTIPEAGQIVGIYALGVMLSGPIMTLALTRLSKRKALIIAMGIFTIGNLLSALAPNYTMLLIARLITSFNHGVFIGLGAVVAASVVPEERKASAIAMMFMGITIANIGGVPAATWIGQHINWRYAFGIMAIFGVIAMAVLRCALPKGTPGKVPDIAREVRILGRPGVLLAVATSALGSAAMFTLYTYIAPVLEELTHASKSFVTLSLVLIGTGFTLGNGIGGRLADWSIDGATRLILATLALIMLILPLLLSSHVGAAAGLFAWGAASFAIVTPLQTRVMQAASEAPGLASSINAGAFNFGNALGATIGGGVISFDLGYSTISITGGLLAIASLFLALSARSTHKLATAGNT